MSKRRAALLVLWLAGCESPFRPDGGDAPDAGADPIQGSDSGAPADAGGDAGAADAGPVIVPGTAWANLQYPAFFTSAPGAATAVFGQLWVDGQTHLPGATPGVAAELGVGPSNTMPGTAAGWSWTPAHFNLDVGNNDEFSAQLVAPDAGLYDYAFRFQLAPGAPWNYADRSDDARAGTDDGYQPENAGRLAVRVSGAELRVATQNLQCVAGSPGARLEVAARRFAQLGVEAVTLQEVCVDASLGNTAQHLAARLGDLTGRPWRHFFVPTHLANGVTPEGVGIITSLPVAATASRALPTASFPRSTLLVVAASGVGMVSLSTVHLSFEATASGAQDWLAQVGAVADFVQGYEAQVAAQVVSGDFNSTPGEGPAQRLVDAGFVDAWAATAGAADAGFTYPTSSPAGRIDYIFSKRAVPAEARLDFGLPADGGPSVSDHLGVNALLRAP